MNHVLYYPAHGAPSWLVPVPHLDGDVIATVELIHQILAVLADWERSDPGRAGGPDSALPHPLAGGLATSALARIGDACQAALTDAAQPLTPTTLRPLDPIGWAYIAVEDLLTLVLAAQQLGRALVPGGNVWAEEAITTVAARDGHSPAAIVMGAGHLYGAFTLTWDDTLNELARRLPAGAGTVTLDRAAHIAYSRFATVIHDLWFHTSAPFTTLEFQRTPRTTGSPRGARPSRATPCREQSR